MSQRMPEAVRRYVREYIRQRRMLRLARGLSPWFTVMVGWMVLWCLADRAWQLEAWARWVVLWVSLAVFGGWLAEVLKAALLERVGMLEAALEVEGLRPELQEKLATVCSRMTGEGGETLGSGQMLAVVAGEVERYVQATGPVKLLTRKSVGKPAVCAAAMVGAVLALGLMPMIGLPKLLVRFAMPWMKTGPVSTTKLVAQVSEEGVDLREGEGFVLNAGVLWPGEEGVTLHFSSDGKTWSKQTMACVGQDRYQAMIGPIAHDARFYVSSGDAKTAELEARLLRRPAVTEFRVRYVYPAYMQREPLLARNVDGLIEAPAGTGATVQVVSTERLKSAEIRAGDLVLPLAATKDPLVMETKLAIVKDTPYTVKMVSAKGVEGSGPGGPQIHALVDRPPFVQLISPRDDVRVSPRDIAVVKYQAIDDYGVSRFALRLQVNNTQPMELALKGEGDPRRQEGEKELDMASFGLKVGDVVAVSLVARDGAGQESSSEVRYLFISPHSVSSADYTRMSELQKAADAAGEVAKNAEAAVAAMQRAGNERNNADHAAEAMGVYQQRVADMGQLAQGLRQAVMRALARSNDRKLNDMLEAIADRAEVRMIESHDLIDEVGKGEAREKNASDRLARAAEQMKRVQEQLQTLATSERAAAALADRRNMKAAEQAQQSGRMSERATELLGRMSQDVADQTRQLGLNPDEASVEQQLEAKAKEGKDLAEKAMPLNLVEASESWAEQLLKERVHGPMFDRRLAAAAEVESVRPDGDYQRASDLNLSGKAAAAIFQSVGDPDGRAAANVLRREYVKAFGVLEDRHKTAAGLQLNVVQEQTQRVRRAREKMAQWAGASESGAGPVSASKEEDAERETAMDANELMYSRRYDRVSELQRRMAMERQQAMAAAQSLKEAQTADELSVAQDALRQELLASQAEMSALAQRQREVARRIEAQMGTAEVAGAPKDSRKDAIAAIQAVQERLAQMPQQLQEATQAVDVQLQAHDLAQRLAKEAQAAGATKKEASQRAADRAGVAEKDARKQTEASLASIDPEVARVLASNLEEFYPETTSAAQVLTGKLQPALLRMKRGAQENSGQDAVAGARQAREAIAESQRELRDAQQTLLDQDPLFAAKMYADAAAAALSRHPPDVEGAKANQSMVSDALSRRWSQSVRDAATQHLASVGRFKSVYDEGSTAVMKGDVNVAANRQWGTLRDRAAEEFSAANRDEDPSGYRKMLQVYFRALGRSKVEETK